MGNFQIPKTILSQIQSDNTERVILLYLSVLNKTPEYNLYQKDNEYFCGLSQLEPGTKHFLTSLAAEGKKANRIVVLETPECRKKLKESEGGYSTEWDGELSARDVYISRIRSFLKGEKPYDAGKDAPGEESTICSEVRYEDAELDKLFVEIEIRSGDANFYPLMVEAIRSRNSEHSVDLYIDMQGGDRSAIAQINAITELLKDQSVRVKERVAVKYIKGQKVHPIEDVAGWFRSYDLITAMSIFKKYGRGKELVEYFEGVEDRNVKKLTEAIKKASDAIQLCDVAKFDDAITYIEKLRNEIDCSENTEMTIVYNDIYEDYKPLFCPKYRYVEQIRWCLKKEYVQQALTILESKMPAEYVQSGLKYYCDREEDVNRLLEAATGKCSNFGKPYQYQFKDINHYFIRSQKVLEHFIWEEKYGLNDSKAIEQNITDYEELCKLRNGTNHANDAREGRFIKYAREKGLEFENVNSENVAKKVKQYLNSFEKLADRVPGDIRKKVIDLG